MKDALHHLKHVQKKVIQSLRREEEIQEKTNNHNHYSQASSAVVAEVAPVTLERRADTNHRVPRIPVRSSVH